MLLNAHINSLDELRMHLRERGWDPALHACQSDVVAVRNFVVELGDIVDASVRGDETAVVDAINRILTANPVRPCIARHDGQPWHLHVFDIEGSVADILITTAAFGLALFTVEMGTTRLGRCAAEDCQQAFLDTTTKIVRKFCSARCASRTHVAEHRRRQKKIGHSDPKCPPQPVPVGTASPDR
jgi:predicted RNA-binding Zn ribbon-like protein